MSDYDILVVTSGVNDKYAGQILDNIDEIYYKNPDKQTPVQFINEDIKKLNKDLEEGRYFYTQIKEEGIILYDTGKLKLARRRKLNFDEIKQQAQEYFKEKFESANDKFKMAQLGIKEKLYRDAIFMLHQASQQTLLFFESPFSVHLNPKNRWIVLEALPAQNKQKGVFYRKNIFPSCDALDMFMFS